MMSESDWNKKKEIENGIWNENERRKSRGNGRKTEKERNRRSEKDWKRRKDKETRNGRRSNKG